MPKQSYELKGFLSFLILWLLSREEMTGAELANEFRKRKGAKPSPGTIYPALKELRQKGLVRTSKDKKYSLTSKGKRELATGLNSFFEIFCDIEEMRKGCGRC
ncbi:PadR family transcriptional regulator [Candidatus Woesearchaeota archaeon]|nr:PadR family transcriptional regulator [Candidatus Woesearchaeota archaeon]